jgi:hypothetical protein
MSSAKQVFQIGGQRPLSMKYRGEQQMRLGLITSLLASFLALGVAGMATAGPGVGDLDGDTIDDFFDNCTTDSNPGQVDSDYDGCGNHCDGDFDQDAVTNGADFFVFRSGFIAAASGVTDMTGDGLTNGADFFLFRSQFIQGVPGPSSNTFKDASVCP